MSLLFCLVSGLPTFIYYVFCRDGMLHKCFLWDTWLIEIYLNRNVVGSLVCDYSQLC